MRELSLFTGAGGGLLASALLGWELVACCEKLPSQRARLELRMAEGLLPTVPIHPDVQTLDGGQYKGKIDVISGGFPCQDISCANPNPKGIGGARSGLWSEYARIIGESEPKWVFIENAKELRTRGLFRVLEDLAALGYNAAWDIIGGEAVGAPQTRKRMWVVAHSSGHRIEAYQAICKRNPRGKDEKKDGLREGSLRGSWWPSLDGIPRLADGFSDRVGEAFAYGNAQIPVVAAFAFTSLAERIICAERER